MKQKDNGIAWLVGAFVLVFMLPMGTAHAYSTFLTISNNQNWAQPQDFAEVTIDAIDVGGGDFDFMFTVDLCADPSSSACLENQQIEQFGLNVAGGISLTTANFDLPADWSANIGGGGNNMSIFGTFDVTVNFGGPRAAGEQPLVFSIIGVTGDSIMTYATEGSTGGQPQSGSLFSAKVSSTGPGAFIGGGSPVPVPAAVWLFGSGLLGLVAIARRRRA